MPKLKRVYVREKDYKEIMKYAKENFIKNKRGVNSFAEALHVINVKNKTHIQ